MKILQCGDFCGEEPGMVDVFCTFGYGETWGLKFSDIVLLMRGIFLG